MKYATLLTLFLSLTLSCKEQDIYPTASKSPCAPAGEITMQVFSRNGLAYYDKYHNLFSIQTAIPNTYDVVDVGIVCNMPENLQQEIIEAGIDQKLVKVVFSGSYREVIDDKYSGPVGYTYYYLSLSSIHIEHIYTPE